MFIDSATDGGDSVPGNAGQGPTCGVSCGDVTERAIEIVPGLFGLATVDASDSAY